jgi:multiple sugar transport system substrate-binding protein
MLTSNPSQVDVVSLRFGTFVPWVEAGYIQPLEGLEGYDAWIDQKLDIVKETFTYEGHMYASDWSGQVIGFMYNERILTDAGFDDPPETWDELVDQCLAIQDEELCDYGLTLPLIANADRLSRVWFAIGTSMDGTEYAFFDADKEPTWTSPDSAGYKAAEFMYNCTNVWNINPLASLETEYFPQMQMLGNGEIAFAIESAPFQIKSLNTGDSSEAGNIKIMLWPDTHYGLTQLPTGVGITKACFEKGEDWQDAVWEYFRGFNGPEIAKDITAISTGSPTTFKALQDDPEIRAAWGQWMNLEEWDEQMDYLLNLRNKINVVSQESWWKEFERDYVHVHLQSAVRGDITIAQAMQNIYDGWDGFQT